MSKADIAEAERLREAERAVALTGIERWQNLVEMFFGQAEKLGSAAMLWRRSGESWQSISWADAARTVATIATALRANGVTPGSRVVLISENRPEFCLWDLGIMAAGAITVPTYTTNTARDHAHILSDSGAIAAVVSGPKLAKPLMEALIGVSSCKLVIGLEPLGLAQHPPHVDVTDAASLMAAHTGSVAAVKGWARMKRQDTACIIYTSGTGGTPRGVLQHHGAILHNVAGCVDVIRNDFPDTGRETFLSFLPLSHAYEHTAGQFLPIGLGGEIYYAESLERLSANIEEVRPSIMVVVPRLFEVLRMRMLKAIDKQGGMAPRMLAQAEALTRKRATRGGLSMSDRLLDAVIERTLRRKVRDKLGGRIKAMVSGGAPLNPDVGIFFQSIGVTLLQGYGQTEAGPVISCNRPATGIKMHTVGPPLKDVDVRIAEDGEILVAGELVMSGYWNRPEESEAALRDGWLHTGDIGELDEDGHIVITDRKKDIIVNDKGDNVAPQRIEGMLTLQPEIGQAMVYGDRRPHLVGVVVPDAEWAAEWAASRNLDPEGLNGNPEFVRAVQAAVDRVNTQLSVIEKVRRVMLADAPFTVENEQMTPSLKIRRHVLKQAYGARLDALYH